MQPADKSSQLNLIGPILFFVSLVTILFFPFLVGYQYSNTSVKLATSESPTFSAERAFAHLSQLLEGIESHPVDSHQNHVVADRIINKLTALKLNVIEQIVPSCVDSGNGRAHCATVRNIVATLPGSKPTRHILLSAHYDSVAAAPGASDAGIAVASLLEIASLLSQQSPPNNTFTFLFNDGEEYGLLGARAFLSDYALSNSLTDVINLDAIGSTGVSLLIETAKADRSLLENFARASHKPVASSIIADLWARGPSDTDMTIYKRAGLRGYNFINLENDPHYHTPLDNLSNVSLHSLQHHGDNAWGLVSLLQNKLLKDTSVTNSSNLRTIHQDDADVLRVVYTDILSFTLVFFDNNEVYALVGLCLMIFGWANKRLFSQKLILLRSLIASHFAVVIILFSGMVTAIIAKKFVQLSLNSIEPWNSQFQVMQLFLFFIVITTSVWLGSVLFQYQDRLSRSVAIANCYLFGLIVSTLYYPQYSVLFIASAFFAVGLVFLSTFSTAKRLLASMNYLWLLISLISFLSATYHFQTMMKFYLSPIIGVLISLSILPLFMFVRQATLPIKLKDFFNFHTSLTAIPSLLFSGICFYLLSSKPIYIEQAPRDLNLKLISIDEQPANLTFEHDTPKHLPAKLGIETTSKTINLPWSNQSLLGFAAQQNVDHQLVIKNTHLEHFQTSQALTLNVNTEKDRLAGVKLFLPANSNLNFIDYLGTQLDYANDQRQNKGYYEFHCIGERCAKLKLKLTFTKPYKGKFWIKRIYHSLPSTYQELIDKRNEIASPKSRGDQMWLIKEYQL